MHTSDNYPEASRGRTGLLLISLGTPDTLTYGSVRRFLAEFLSDKRVIETPRALWLPILYGPILTLRPFKSLKAYAKIWDNERSESPLMTISREQAGEFSKLYGDDVVVDWAFTYGEPSVKRGLKALQEKGCDRILLFALYPQYSATSTAAAYDCAFKALSSMRWQPAVRTVPAYFDQDIYTSALADAIKSERASLSWTPAKILASYHSIPKAYADKGDPYPQQCRSTSRLLAGKLDMEEGILETSFQSRVGMAEWVGPYTDKKVVDLAKSGVKKLMVLAPAFSSDCLETLEEINIALRETFLQAGGTHFHYIPCLNAGKPGMRVLKSVTDTELKGWV